MSAPKTSPSRQSRRALVSVSLAGVLVAAGALGFLAQRDSTTAAGQRSAGGALPAAEFPDPGVVHVHGLGVDPADGTLYAATHSGLFEIPGEGQARRIANRYQDTMGFTIAEPGVFLGSGHPDPREDDVRPPLLGLIESTDQGQTWERLSLHGEADFHALQAVHGQVYGYDATSSTFMVSQDKQNWQRRAQLPMVDFAVDPADPEVVLATTQQGLARSTDGGRSFTFVDTAPVLVVLAWSSSGSLYGIDPIGLVHHSRDGASSWVERGRIGGEPEAMTVQADGDRDILYAAATDRGIVVSEDGGATFAVRYADRGPSAR